MTLTKSLAPLVSPGVRQRGQSYYRQGAVLLLGGDDSEVAATVLGSRPYTVTIGLDHGQIEASCDCPYFQDRDDLCKHVWATALAAEEEGYLLEGYAPEPSRPVPRPSGARQGQGSSESAPSWMAQLSRIEASQSEEPDRERIERTPANGSQSDFERASPCSLAGAS